MVGYGLPLIEWLVPSPTYPPRTPRFDGASGSDRSLCRCSRRIRVLFEQLWTKISRRTRQLRNQYADLSTPHCLFFCSSRAHLKTFEWCIPKCFAIPLAVPRLINIFMASFLSCSEYRHFFGSGVYSLLHFVQRNLLLPADVFPMLCWPVISPHLGHFRLSFPMKLFYIIADILSTPFKKWIKAVIIISKQNKETLMWHSCFQRIIIHSSRLTNNHCIN